MQQMGVPEMKLTKPMEDRIYNLVWKQILLLNRIIIRIKGIRMMEETSQKEGNVANSRFREICNNW